jgi:predicted pyridoxine 5'-phosphate oxidase superfamily flavin-nucleotide-binding protein
MDLDPRTSWLQVGPVIQRAIASLPTTGRGTVNRRKRMGYLFDGEVRRGGDGGGEKVTSKGKKKEGKGREKP